MSADRTYWWPKAADWHRSEDVIALFDQFGATGPLALDWLACEARALLDNDRGRVETGYMALAHSLRINTDTARALVAYAVEVGALLDFEELGRTKKLSINSGVR